MTPKTASGATLLPSKGVLPATWGPLPSQPWAALWACFSLEPDTGCFSLACTGYSKPRGFCRTCCLLPPHLSWAMSSSSLPLPFSPLLLSTLPTGLRPPCPALHSCAACSLWSPIHLRPVAPVSMAPALSSPLDSGSSVMELWPFPAVSVLCLASIPAGGPDSDPSQKTSVSSLGPPFCSTVSSCQNLSTCTLFPPDPSPGRRLHRPPVDHPPLHRPSQHNSTILASMSHTPLGVPYLTVSVSMSSVISPLRPTGLPATSSELRLLVCQVPVPLVAQALPQPPSALLLSLDNRLPHIPC